MSKKVIAYEDDPALRKQLESVFYSIRNEYLLVATFPNPISVLEELKTHAPDMVLMDLQMLDEDDGLVALYKIKQTAPHIKVLVLTMFDTDHKVFNAICLGADGYMLKSDFSTHRLPHEAMRQSLQTLFEEGAYLTPTVAKQIMKLFRDQSIGEKIKKVTERFQAIFQKEVSNNVHSAKLTRMQTAVLDHIIEGKSTAKIASEMNLSENTINTHIKGIYATLEVHSRALAIKKAMENKWYS